MNQQFSVQDIEPADIEPAKLRAFAIKLIIIAIIFAVVIVYNYKKNTERQEDQNRPPRIHPVKKKLEVSTFNDSAIQVTAIVSGKVSLIVPISLTQPQKAQVTLESVARISKGLNDQAKSIIQVVLMSMSPEEDTVESMREWLQANYDFSGLEIVVIDGSSTTPEQAQDTRDFAKKQFRFEPLYKDKDTKKWVFPTLVALVDTQRTFRGRYDFDEAYSLAEEYGQTLEKTLTTHINYLVEDSQKIN